MTVSILVPKLSPEDICNTPMIRANAGPINTGAVTYDVDFGEYARWIYVGTAGNLAYVKWDGTTETLPNLAIGWHQIPSIRVNTTGTTIAAAQLRWGS